VLKLSLEEARQLGHNYIGTEHLLLGLSQDGEGGSQSARKSGRGSPGNAEQVIRMLEKLRCYLILHRVATPALDEFGSNLTQMAAAGSLTQSVVKEIERVIQILGRRTKNNPVLIGEPGSAKRAR